MVLVSVKMRNQISISAISQFMNSVFRSKLTSAKRSESTVFELVFPVFDVCFSEHRRQYTDKIYAATCRRSEHAAGWSPKSSRSDTPSCWHLAARHCRLPIATGRRARRRSMTFIRSGDASSSQADWRSGNPRNLSHNCARPNVFDVLKATQKKRARTSCCTQRQTTHYFLQDHRGSSSASGLLRLLERLAPLGAKLGA